MWNFDVIPKVVVLLDLSHAAGANPGFNLGLWLLERIILPSAIALGFALLVQNYIAVRDLRTQIVQRCLTQIEELGRLCSSYWLQGPTPSDLLTEERIEAILLEIIDLRMQCANEAIIAPEANDVPTNEQLIETITSGTYRSASRTPDAQVARRIVQDLTRVRRSIFEARRARLSQFLAR